MHALFNGRTRSRWSNGIASQTGYLGKSRIFHYDSCRFELVDDMILVSESSIEEAIVFAGRSTVNHRRIGSSRVGGGDGRQNQSFSAVIVISGGNIQPEMHQEFLARYRTKADWDETVHPCCFVDRPLLTLAARCAAGTSWQSTQSVDNFTKARLLMEKMILSSAWVNYSWFHSKDRISAESEFTPDHRVQHRRSDPACRQRQFHRSKRYDSSASTLVSGLQNIGWNLSQGETPTSRRPGGA